MPKWDPERLRQELADHLVEGYPVVTDLMGSGVIERQTRPELGGFVFYKVVADKPIPFKRFAEMLGVDNTPMTLKEWEEKYASGSRSMPAMAADLLDILDEGGRVSRADVLFKELLDRGCLDADQNVYCFTFPSDEVKIADPKKGMLVEVVADRTTGWPGKIAGFTRKEGEKIVLVEQFSPVPFMHTPEALLPSAVKKSYALPTTWSLGYELVNAMEDAGVELPKGAWTEGTQDYVLEKQILLSRIEDFCREHHPDVELCSKQAMMMTTLPLVLNEIELRPLPEGTTDDVVASITDIEDPESIDISYPEEE